MNANGTTESVCKYVLTQREDTIVIVLKGIIWEMTQKLVTVSVLAESAQHFLSFISIYILSDTRLLLTHCFIKKYYQDLSKYA